MGHAAANPYHMLEVAEDASMQDIDAAYARATALLDGQSLTSYGMFDEASQRLLQEQLGEAYRAIKALRAATPQGAASAPTEVLGPPPSAVAVAQKRSQEPPPPIPMPPQPVAAAFGARSSDCNQATDAPTAAPPPAATHQSALRLRLCAPRDEPLQEPLTGALLRQLREACGADIDDVSEVTKINRRYIVALEEEDFPVLPAAVYVRGFVGEYVRVLGLGSHTSAPYVEAYNQWANAHR